MLDLTTGHTWQHQAKKNSVVDLLQCLGSLSCCIIQLLLTTAGSHPKIFLLYTLINLEINFLLIVASCPGPEGSKADLNHNAPSTILHCLVSLCCYIVAFWAIYSAVFSSQTSRLEFHWYKKNFFSSSTVDCQGILWQTSRRHSNVLPVSCHRPCSMQPCTMLCVW